MDIRTKTPETGDLKNDQEEARGVLEFDTGLDARAFAQAKLAHLVAESGYLVTGGEGSWTPWKPKGVYERNGTMRIWGSGFTGERLDMLVADDTRKDLALDALRYWIRARLLGEAQPGLPSPWPAGAIIGPSGRILFPPEELIRYSIDAAGPQARFNGVEGYVHPDLPGMKGTAFTAGALLYRIFCGSPPFPNTTQELLYQDIREGVFLPPQFAVPGLDAKLAALISQALSPFMGKRTTQQKTLGEQASEMLHGLGDLLGPPGSAAVASYLHELDPAEQARLTLAKERFIKKHIRGVKTKRFIHRNTSLIAGISIGVLGVALLIKSGISDQANRPSTRGMSPQEVVETYYHSMSSLDHPQMEACVMPKIGKEDIDMVTNLFVISRVRQAYERGAPVIFSAQEWIDAGSPPTEATVFGVSELELEVIDQNEQDGEVSFAASYRIWFPGTFRNPDEPGQTRTDSEASTTESLPWSSFQQDFMRLTQYQGSWRIAEIQRLRRAKQGAE
ncbi:MAG: hypothetical protein LBK43_06225 [Treponema sp.]|jgi:hypothetical protein|nr:hypothetical protein [Treponema sp.]